MAKRKSLLQRIGDALKGANQQDLAGKVQEKASEQKEQVKDAAVRQAEQLKEQARRQAEHVTSATEVKAAQLQRELAEKERELRAREEALAREEAERKKEEIRAQIQRQKEAIAARKTGETASTQPRVYVVQPGDSLSKIAKAIYGDANRWPEIFEANRDKIKDPNLIYPNQELRIP